MDLLDFTGDGLLVHSCLILKDCLLIKIDKLNTFHD